VEYLREKKLFTWSCVRRLKAVVFFFIQTKSVWGCIQTRVHRVCVPPHPPRRRKRVGRHTSSLRSRTVNVVSVLCSTLMWKR